MKVFLATSDDWEVIYIDGNKVVENHRLSARDVIKGIGARGHVEKLSYTIEYFSPDLVESFGCSFPQDPMDLPIGENIS